MAHAGGPVHHAGRKSAAWPKSGSLDMAPPFAFLQGWPLRGLVFAILATIAGLVMLFRLGPLDDVLRTRVPGGILAFEFAWTGEAAEAILSAWRGLEPVAILQTRWDFLFLLTYPVALSVACVMLSDAPANPVAMIGVFVAWAVLAAVPLDAMENLAMLWMLEHGAREGLAKLATGCAGVKFTVLLAAVGYLLLAGAVTPWQRLST